MKKLRLNNIVGMQIQTHSTPSISEGMVISHLRMLAPYTEKLQKALEDNDYTLPEALLRTPFDTEVLETICKNTERFSEKTKTVLLVGIGGSYMGTCALYDALRGHMEHFQGTPAPKLVAFATVDPHVLNSITELLAKCSSAEEIVLIVISKSGTTTESLANANILFSQFAERFGNESANRQTIVISDANSPLTKRAVEQGMLTFPIPARVGGRYSIFTAVGLVPLRILGFDIHAFLKGAQEAFTASTNTKKASGAAVLASFLFEAYLQGARVHELFMWNPELETLGKWYSQLLAESIGKERDDGTAVGFTPTVALGSTDLHSIGQLIFGGRNDRYTTFVSAPTAWESGHRFSSDSPFVLPVFEGKEDGKVTRAMYEGVRNAYATHDLPFVSIELASVSERELGAFMALQMTTILFLAQLFDVNAFDQPSVEKYKNEVRRLLTS